MGGDSGVLLILLSAVLCLAILSADLLVAACAEEAELTVLHYDADFDRIAKLTGQPAQWMVRRGSVP